MLPGIVQPVEHQIIYVCTIRKTNWMRYPNWRCRHCGARLYEHVNGGYLCLNCERRYAADFAEYAA